MDSQNPGNLTPAADYDPSTDPSTDSDFNNLLNEVTNTEFDAFENPAPVAAPPPPVTSSRKRKTTSTSKPSPSNPIQSINITKSGVGPKKAYVCGARLNGCTGRGNGVLGSDEACFRCPSGNCWICGQCYKYHHRTAQKESCPNCGNNEAPFEKYPFFMVKETASRSVSADANAPPHHPRTGGLTMPAPAPAPTPEPPAKRTKKHLFDEYEQNLHEIMSMAAQNLATARKAHDEKMEEMQALMQKYKEKADRFDQVQKLFNFSS